MRNTIEYPIIDLELISPIKLRDKFKIYDNNQYVNISIDKKHLKEQL
jgi:CTP-dependent riboflavin kinase